MLPGKTMFAGFAPPSDRHWRVLESSGCEMIIFGLDDEDDDRRGVDPSDYHDTWKPRSQWRAGRLEAAIGRAHSMGVATGVHYWVRPVRKWLDEAHDYIRRLHAAHRISVVMGDIERYALRMKPALGGFADWSDVLDSIERAWAPPKYSTVFPGWPSYAIASYGLPNPITRAAAEREFVRDNVLMVYDADVSLYVRCVEAWATLGLGAKTVMGYGTYADAPRNLEEAHNKVTIAGVERSAFWSLRSTNTAESKRISKL